MGRGHDSVDGECSMSATMHIPMGMLLRWGQGCVHQGCMAISGMHGHGRVGAHTYSLCLQPVDDGVASPYPYSNLHLNPNPNLRPGESITTA